MQDQKTKTVPTDPPDGGIRAKGKPRARSVVFAVLEHQLHSTKKRA
jgi:hypothetical protein